MFCTLKSDVKLLSNIIKLKPNEAVDRYIPFDLKPMQARDVRQYDLLTPAQKEEYVKSLFYAKEVRDTNIRFFDLPENKEMCINCPYRDICY